MEHDLAASHVIAAQELRTHLGRCAARAASRNPDLEVLFTDLDLTTAMSRRLRVLTILRARICSGATWEQIANHLRIAPSTACALYDEAEQRWRRGDRAPWISPDGDRHPVAGPIDLPPSTG
ncbi:hypothetical protein AB0395_21795 [Streptosporangium sp. NPDC051023]|uniref:hypothetical protein n=1 Tax=Streptosporangium sp. NPDC051023 TaxID=3155410 RepID=UPI00344D265F